MPPAEKKIFCCFSPPEAFKKNSLFTAGGEKNFLPFFTAGGEIFFYPFLPPEAKKKIWGSFASFASFAVLGRGRYPPPGGVGALLATIPDPATPRDLNALEEPLDGHISDHHQVAFVQPLYNPRECTRLCACLCA